MCGSQKQQLWLLWIEAILYGIIVVVVVDSRVSIVFYLHDHTPFP